MVTWAPTPTKRGTSLAPVCVEAEHHHGTTATMRVPSRTRAAPRPPSELPRNFGGSRRGDAVPSTHRPAGCHSQTSELCSQHHPRFVTVEFGLVDEVTPIDGGPRSPLYPIDTRRGLLAASHHKSMPTTPTHYSVKKSAGSAFAKCQPWAASQPKSRNRAA